MQRNSDRKTEISEFWIWKLFLFEITGKPRNFGRYTVSGGHRIFFQKRKRKPCHGSETTPPAPSTAGRPASRPDAPTISHQPDGVIRHFSVYFTTKTNALRGKRFAISHFCACLFVSLPFWHCCFARFTAKIAGQTRAWHDWEPVRRLHGWLSSSLSTVEFLLTLPWLSVSTVLVFEWMPVLNHDCVFIIIKKNKECPCP